MEELILTKVPPPYDTECVECDENNPNVWDIDLWNNWLRSIDYLQTNYTPNLHSTENLVAKIGHRGIRIGKSSETNATWYYNIVMGYKIKSHE